MHDLLDTLKNYRSVAITGMAKNAGKTECLNYLLHQMERCGRRTGVTSIGIDGESVDAVTMTRKPEITLSGGTLFVTSESFYRRRRLVSEILETGKKGTALGRPVYGRVIIAGKVILSGPPDTAGLKATISRLHELGAETVLVDGALSRLSLGAPEVTEAVILATGAALSPSPAEIERRTCYTVELMTLPEAEGLKGIPASFTRGIGSIDSEGVFHDMKIPTGLSIADEGGDIYRYGRTFYVAGALTDRMLDRFGKDVKLVIRDFSCMFAAQSTYRRFKARGGRIEVRKRANLVGLTVNPCSPYGYRVDSEKLCGRLTASTGLPAIDIRKEEGRMN